MKRSGLNCGIIALALSGLISACNSGENKKSEGDGIVMGDPSTIVTEADSTHLRDIVAELKPADLVKDTAMAPPPDTAKKPDGTATQTDEKAQKAAVAQKGLDVEFSELTVTFPGIEGKLAGNTNLKKASAATYRLTEGDIRKSSLVASGATVTNVSMRYQTTIDIRNDLGLMELDALASTANWKSLKGSNNTYSFAGLEEKNLATARVNSGTLRNAIYKEARQRKMSSKLRQQWLNSVRSVRSARQKPLEVRLKAVMFKIDGKDKAGKSFSKQIRIDI